MSCKFPKEWLQAWLDGELAGKRAAETREHLERCRHCAHQVDSWRQVGEELQGMVDRGLGEVEPLVALEKIRERVAAAESRSMWSALRAWWHEMLLFHRRTLASMAVAAAVGALAAPGVVYLVGLMSEQASSMMGPAVVVESLEVGGNSTAVVLGGEGSTTTLIWVEPPSHESYEETF